MMDTISKDLRIALRRLASTPVFTAMAVLVIALGIGANTAIFSAVNAALFRPLPFEGVDRLVHVYQSSDDGSPESTSFPAYRRIAERTDVFANAAAVYLTNAALETDSGIKPAVVEFVTSSYFPLFGLRPLYGRWFSPDEDRSGTGAQAVVSHLAWQNRFGGDPNILGSSVRLNGAPVTIVGIGPASYNGIISGSGIDFWLSLSALQIEGPYAAATLDQPGDHWFQVKARLRSDVNIQQAQEAMNALASALETEFAGRDEKRTITVFPFDGVRVHPSFDGALAPAATALMAVVGLVLALGCSNIAILLLIRGAARSRDVSIRVAMGATRRRIIREFLTESVLLSAMGGIAGYFVAAWSVRALTRFQLPASLPVNFDITIDYRVLGFAIALSLLTGIAFGLAPALKASRTDVMSVLRDGGSATRRGQLGLKSVLAGVQVTMSVLLLVATGLFVRSLMNSADVEIGFDVAPIAFVETNAGYAGYSVEQSRARFDQLEDRIAALPGVEAVTRSAPLPVSRRGTSTLFIEDSVLPPGTEGTEVPFATVGTDYFETLKIPILYGRGFGPADSQGAPSVAVVSETAARRYWGTPNAVGKRFRAYTGTAWVEVVGVARDVKVQSAVEEPRPLMYRPWNQRAATFISFLVRTRGDANAMTSALRRTVREFDAALPVLRADTFAGHLGEQLFMSRIAVAFLMGFSLVGLMLAGFGLYAVVSFSVAERSMEVGIRMALGAGTGQVLWMIVRRVMLTVGISLAAGIVLSLAVMQQLTGLLYNISASDPLTLAAVSGVLSLVALAATYIPARRAATSDPMASLRIK